MGVRLGRAVGNRVGDSVGNRVGGGVRGIVGGTVLVLSRQSTLQVPEMDHAAVIVTPLELVKNPR